MIMSYFSCLFIFNVCVCLQDFLIASQLTIFYSPSNPLAILKFDNIELNYVIHYLVLFNHKTVMNFPMKISHKKHLPVSI